MPHIIVEYSSSLENEIAEALSQADKALKGEDIDSSKIKTRGIALNHAFVGDKDTQGKMAHITLLLLEGRELATKKHYGNIILTKIKASLPADTEITMEIRDMDRDTYYM